MICKSGNTFSLASVILLIIGAFDLKVTRSSNDMLFIRHGRSRVRHSNEKDHLRWGLQAFDNLTLDYEGYDNDTVIFGSGSGGTAGQLFGSDFWLNSDNNGTTVGGTNQSTQTPRQEPIVLEESDGIINQLVTTIAAPIHKKRKLHKKKLMESIKKNVDKGLMYLRMHENLGQNDESALSQEFSDEKFQQVFTESSSSKVKIKTFSTLEPPGGNITPYPVPTHYNKQQTSVIAQREISHITTEKHYVASHIPDEKDNNNGDSHDDRKSPPNTSLTSAELHDVKNNEAYYELNDVNNGNIQQNHHTGDRGPNHSDSTNLKTNGLKHYAGSQNTISSDVNFEEINLDGGTDDDDNFATEVDTFNGEEAYNSFNLEDSSGNTGTNKFLEEVPEGAGHEDDLYDWDEISRNNRRNLMRGRDVVTKFLQIVETQHSLGSNCEAGTSLNLGEGVVDRYAQDRFRVEAEVAVNRANMLTRIFKMTLPSVQASVNLLHASVLSMVEFDDDIFAAGNCFDWNQHPSQQGLFCPFAYRLPPPNHGALFAKDLATEYHYLGNTSEWFFLARKNAEKVIARNDQYVKAFHLYSNKTEERIEENTLFVRYEDGRWSKPYYDCGGGNIWMLTYTVPFFGYENGTYFFKGTSGIDIDLRRVDIDQCPQRNSQGTTQPLNIFAGTDKCKQRTTMCEALKGLGFRRGSYKCVCRKGFYFPDTLSMHKFFNGSLLEEEYEKLMLGKNSTYNIVQEYECLPCAEGCDSCEDSSPCIAALNWPMRTSILVLACAIIGLLPPAAWFTFRYQQVKVVRAASPALLRVIALGAFFIYCTTIVMYPNPSLYTCTARIWLREIGFSLTYGALMLKTWRISVIFRVRSAKAVKITDAALLRRLGVICAVIGICLLVRTLVSPPTVVVGRTADDLKAFLCKTDWWDYTFTSMEVLFLAWGVRLCIMVRKAPSEFNESRFISMAIYNEFLLTCFLNVSMLFLQSPANPDLLYIIFFSHTQLTVTLLLGLIFGSKVYIVLRSGKSHQEAVGMGAKSSGAKFNFRPQVRTFANPSSATTSTAQLETKLSDQEALEEVRLLSIQLQRLQEMAPPKGVAVMTISHVLDSLKPTSISQIQESTTKLQQQQQTTSFLIPISSVTNSIEKYQQNNNITTIVPIVTTNSKLVPVLEKSVSTSLTGEDYLKELMHQNQNFKCTHCKQTESSISVLSCQELGSPKPDGSIYFSNIKLDCMCLQPGDLDRIFESDERSTEKLSPSKTNMMTTNVSNSSTKTRITRRNSKSRTKTSKFLSSSNLHLTNSNSTLKNVRKGKLTSDISSVSNNHCDKHKSSEHFLICDSCRNKLSNSLIQLSFGGKGKKTMKHRSSELLDRSICEGLSAITGSFSSTTSTIGCEGERNSSGDLTQKKIHSTDDVTFYTTDEESVNSPNEEPEKDSIPKREDTHSTSSSTSILPSNMFSKYQYQSDNNSQSNVSTSSAGTRQNSDETQKARRPDKLLLDLNDRSKYTKEVSV